MLFDNFLLNLNGPPPQVLLNRFRLVINLLFQLRGGLLLVRPNILFDRAGIPTLVDVALDRVFQDIYVLLQGFFGGCLQFGRDFGLQLLLDFAGNRLEFGGIEARVAEQLSESESNEVSGRS